MADTKLSAIATQLSALAGTERFATSDGTATAKFGLISQILTYIASFGNTVAITVEFWQKLRASFTLTSQTAQQKLFNGTANGTLTLPTGVYFFECMLDISGMSATSGNGAFEILGAGTATLINVLYEVLGIDNSTPLVAGTATMTGSTTSTGAASLVTAGTGTGVLAYITGTFEVSVAGTIIPSIALVTASAAVVAAGSYFKCHNAGATGAVSSGPWS